MAGRALLCLGISSCLCGLALGGHMIPKYMNMQKAADRHKPGWQPYDEPEPLLTDETLQKLFEKMDMNKDGSMTYDEMMDFDHEDHKNKLSDEETKEAMKDYDFDQDGKVTLLEHLRFFNAHEAPDKRKHGQAEIDRIANEKELQTRLFNAADKNKDGVLELGEAHELYLQEHHSEEVLQHIMEIRMRDLDTDGDGKLSHAEFDKEGNHYETMGSFKYRILFNKIDEDKDDFLSMDELKHWETGRAERLHALRELFQMADTNKDEKVDSAEFVASRKLWNEYSELHDIEEHLLVSARRHGYVEAGSGDRFDFDPEM